MINTNIPAFVGTNRTQGLATSGLFSAHPLWTKADAGRLPRMVINKAMHYLKLCSPDFPANTRTEMLKVGLLLGRTQFYAQSLLEYATTVSSFEGSCQHVASPLPTRNVIHRSVRSWSGSLYRNFLQVRFLDFYHHHEFLDKNIDDNLLMRGLTERREIGRVSLRQHSSSSL